MGGISSDSGEKLNIELNLVPFIDLLSSLVLFLLITAVWIQVSALPTGIDAKGNVSIVTAEQSNLVSVHLNDKGHEILWPATLKNADKLPILIERKPTGFDLERLTEIFAGVVRDGGKPTAAVSADETIEYGELVRTIDTLKQGGLESVALSTN